jgi:hypothetical protein
MKESYRYFAPFLTVNHFLVKSRSGEAVGEVMTREDWDLCNDGERQCAVCEGRRL